MKVLSIRRVICAESKVVNHGFSRSAFKVFSGDVRANYAQIVRAKHVNFSCAYSVVLQRQNHITLYTRINLTGCIVPGISCGQSQAEPLLSTHPRHNQYPAI